MTNPPVIFDPFEDAPDDIPNMTSYLGSKGWEAFFEIGGENSHLHMQSWRRADGTDEYIVHVSDSSSSAPYLRVDGFVAVMDLFARWSPALETAAVVGALDDLSAMHLSNYGLMEILAAKAGYGAQETQDQLRKELREQQTRSREIHAQRAAERRAVQQGF